MKLGELRKLIREQKGNPSLRLVLAGRELEIIIQKTPLMAALGEAFPEGKAFETNLHYDPESSVLTDLTLLPEDGYGFAEVTTPAADGIDLDDEDDLLLDDEPAAPEPVEDIDLDDDDDDLLV